MPRTPRKQAGSRLNLELSDEARQKLETLRKQTDAESLVDVIRRALTVYDFLWNAKNEGGTLIIRSNHREREVILL